MDKERAYHVLRIFPDTESLGKLPVTLRESIVNKRQYQNNNYVIVIFPLSHHEYKLMSPSRYEPNNVLNILNNNIKIMEGGSLTEIMKWPLLIKNIIDEIYRISGGPIEKLNNSPEEMFEALARYRQQWLSNDALLDQLLLINLGVSAYLGIRSQIKSIEEKISLAALVEVSSDVIIEERYKMAIRLNAPIKLAPDQRFRKEYAQRFGSQTEQAAAEAQAKLAADMKRDKRTGTKRRINTQEENQALNE